VTRPKPAARWAERLGRWALAAVFLYASIPKILDPAGFAVDISHYDIVPEALLPLLAVTLPWIEALGALALITGFAADGASVLILLLLLTFLGGLLQAWVRGIDLECGCFGHKDAGTGNVLSALLRDLAFIGIAIPVVWFRLKWRARDGLEDTASEPAATRP